MKNGSITIFATFSMMLVVSVLFFLLEAARVFGMSQYADWKSRQGMECVAAEYQPYLWKEYRLLLLDGAYGTGTFHEGHLTGHLKDVWDKNLFVGGEPFYGMNLFQMKVNHIYEPQYLLLTDADGEVFLDMAASYLKENFPREVAQEIYDRYRGQKETIEENGSVEEDIEHAKAALEEAKQQASEDGESGDTGEKVAENPLEVALEVKRSMSLSTLGLVVKEPGSISTRQLDESGALLARERNEGNVAYEPSSDWYRKILDLEYAAEMLSSYTNPKETHALAYELEYLIGGKKDDKKNLEEVVRRLLLYRSASNVTYLLTDVQKMEQAFVLATALAGFTGNPAVIKGVEVAIVGAWAYLESIQDVRALLAGGKIALIKSREQWTTDLNHLLTSLETQERAKECDNGFDYEAYLKQMLFFCADRDFAYRFLNLMEQNLRQITAYENCRMDYMIVSFSCEVEFLSEPLFSSLSVIGREEQKNKRYVFRRESQFDYFP